MNHSCTCTTTEILWSKQTKNKTKTYKHKTNQKQKTNKTKTKQKTGEGFIIAALQLSWLTWKNHAYLIYNLNYTWYCAYNIHVLNLSSLKIYIAFLSCIKMRWIHQNLNILKENTCQASAQIICAWLCHQIQWFTFQIHFKCLTIQPLNRLKFLRIGRFRGNRWINKYMWIQFKNLFGTK